MRQKGGQKERRGSWPKDRCGRAHGGGVGGAGEGGGGGGGPSTSLGWEGRAMSHCHLAMWPQLVPNHSDTSSPKAESSRPTAPPEPPPAPCPGEWPGKGEPGSAAGTRSQWGTTGTQTGPARPTRVFATTAGVGSQEAGPCAMGATGWGSRRPGVLVASEWPPCSETSRSLERARDHTGPMSPMLLGRHTVSRGLGGGCPSMVEEGDQEGPPQAETFAESR